MNTTTPCRYEACENNYKTYTLDLKISHGKQDKELCNICPYQNNLNSHVIMFGSYYQLQTVSKQDRIYVSHYAHARALNGSGGRLPVISTRRPKLVTEMLL